MKTKTFLGIMSGMIFAGTLLTGLVIALILFLGAAGKNSARAEESTTSNDAAPVNSESHNDFVYLFDGQALIRFNLGDGSQEAFDLALPAGAYFNNSVLSDDGAYFAYCRVDFQSPGNLSQRLIVRELESNQNLLEHDFGTIIDCNPTAFSPDNSRLAVSLVYNLPAGGIENFPDEPDWAFRIFDVHTGAVARELNADSPNLPDFEAMTEYGFEAGRSAMLKVVSYQADGLDFVAYPYSREIGSFPAFRWDFADNRLTAIEGLGNSGASYLEATGEIVYPYYNEAFPAAQAWGADVTANEIRISDAQGSRTIYRDSENVIAATSFVNGGRQLAVKLVPSYDLDNPYVAMPSRYILLNRDGSIENLNSPSSNYIQILATSSGFGAFRIEQRNNANGQMSNFYQLLRYENGDLSVLWEFNSPMGVNQAWMDYAGISPQDVAPNLTPFAGIN